jgi:hypothetical protein
MNLPPFQRAAVSLIARRLTDRKGCQRFLLADEVGLGKTHVAKGVIDELRRRSRKPFVVFYISSNREIANQNRRKLATADDSEPVDDRLTLFARHVLRRTSQGKATRLLTLTPGTSLFLGRSTGVSEERLLLLFFIRRLRRQLFKKQTKDLFRCSVNKRRWRECSHSRELSRRFPKRFDRSLIRNLRREWSKPLKQLRKLLKDKPNRKAKNRVIGDLRFGLARAVVKALDPSLIVLDEFQRFRDVLTRPTVDHLEGKQRKAVTRHVLTDWFFEQAGPPILLLSATPYRMYATSAEDTGHDLHLKELFDVLRFLAGPNTDEQQLRQLRSLFTRFRERIERVPKQEARDSELLALKEGIETTLRKWICRTERNWYYLDVQKGIDDRVAREGHELPSAAEVRELKGLAQLMVRHAGEGSAQVVDYWKSAPACLAFMSEQYEVQRRLRANRDRTARIIERRLLPAARDLPKLVERNLKMRRLSDALFSSYKSDWPFLWCRPTYTYWRDGLFDSDGPEPRKLLVFSHWRFVPGAIALLLSDRMERMIGCDSGAAWRQSEPLRFRQDRSLGVFDVCFPSPGLAAAVDPTEIALSLAKSSARQVRLRAVERIARGRLKTALRDAGVRVKRSSSGTGRGSLWQIVAALDSARHSDKGGREVEASDWLERALAHYRPSAARRGRQSTEYERDTISVYRSWLGGTGSASDETRWITEQQFDRLLRMALHSPAVCLLRAIQRAVPAATLSSWYSDALNAGLGGVRHFFNRTYARGIVNRSTPHGRGYADRVLDYCARGQLQAVLDEYAFLLAEQETSVDRRVADVAKAVASGLTRVLSLGSGAPRVRVRSANAKRRWVTTQKRSHFALAFAEESSEDGGGRSRRRYTREAFNSPFWPFVLATTSVGQEGLDFHWYCRDVVHWNLPSNPIDLEQREGRINRRNGLVIRRSIAKDISLGEVEPASGAGSSVWTGALNVLRGRGSGVHHERHGLFPHWLYEGGRSSASTERIHRHVFSYWGSRDLQRYRRLKQDLALYRLAFGQVNQEDLLARLRPQGVTNGKDEAGRSSKHLEAYMLNLAPFSRGDAWRAARREAQAHVSRMNRDDIKWLRALLRDAQSILRKAGDVLGPDTVRAGLRLVGYLGESLDAPGSLSRKATAEQAAAALVYLRNPYDDRFDVHRIVGFDDDAKRLTEVARRIG